MVGAGAVGVEKDDAAGVEAPLPGAGFLIIAIITGRFRKRARA
jgi:hypothetical protein